MTQGQSTPASIMARISTATEGVPDIAAFLEIGRLARIGEGLAARDPVQPVVDMEQMQIGMCRNGWRCEKVGTRDVPGSLREYLMIARSPDSQSHHFKVFRDGREIMGLPDLDIIAPWPDDPAERQRLMKLAGGEGMKLFFRYRWFHGDGLASHEDFAECFDMKTGKRVMRYDMGDPADYQPSHGGTPESEMLARVGLDRWAFISEDEAHPAVRRYCKTYQEPPKPLKVINIFDFLPDDVCNHPDCFHLVRFRDWEDDVARPALVNLGYQVGRWRTIEGDSFGTLCRGVSLSKDGTEFDGFYA